MKKCRLEISFFAQKDIQDFELFADYSPDAIRFTERMLCRIASLEYFPKSGKPVAGHPETYRLIYGRFKIFYQYQERKGLVKILRFWRAEREEDPI